MFNVNLVEPRTFLLRLSSTTLQIAINCFVRFSMWLTTQIIFSRTKFFRDTSALSHLFYSYILLTAEGVLKMPARSNATVLCSATLSYILITEVRFVTWWKISIFSVAPQLLFIVQRFTNPYFVSCTKVCLSPGQHHVTTGPRSYRLILNSRSFL